MSYFSLSLTGTNPTLTKGQALTALAALYSKPESHFELHCDHLFELKKPFKLLKKVAEAEAIQHQKCLEEIGISSTIEAVQVSEGLSLILLEDRPAESVECPSCSEITTDPECCSVCNVMIKKFLQQQKIEAQLQRKIEAARNEDIRRAEHYKEKKEADKTRKEAAKK